MWTEITIWQIWGVWYASAKYAESTVNETIQKICGKKLILFGEYSTRSIFFILQNTPIEKTNFGPSRQIFDQNLKDWKSSFIFKNKIETPVSVL